MKPVNWLLLSSIRARLEAFEIWAGLKSSLPCRRRWHEQGSVSSGGVCRPLLRTSLSPGVFARHIHPSSSPIAAPLPQSQLAGYIRVDYEGATWLKAAIAAAATNDTVGKVKSHFNVGLPYFFIMKL
nr:protein EXECUTER 1, chloroplastic [Ipomoea batatas]